MIFMKTVKAVFQRVVFQFFSAFIAPRFSDIADFLSAFCTDQRSEWFDRLVTDGASCGKQQKYCKSSKFFCRLRSFENFSPDSFRLIFVCFMTQPFHSPPWISLILMSRLVYLFASLSLAIISATTCLLPNIVTQYFALVTPV